MSTSTDPLASLNIPVERRFYPRVTPPSPIYVAFGPNNLGILLNVSENGLQVATPSALDLNSAYRVFLLLNGGASTINVSVRTVWTVESQRCSGIQLLDLAEQDREQIRQWVALQTSQNDTVMPSFDEPPQRQLSRESAEAKPQTSEPPLQVDQALSKPEFAPMPLPIHGEFIYEPPSNSRRKKWRASRSVVARRWRSGSSARPLILWTACMVAVSVATGWSFRQQLSDRFLHLPPQVAKESASVVDHRPSTVVPDEPTAIAPTEAPTGPPPNHEDDATPIDRAASPDTSAVQSPSVPAPIASPKSSSSNVAASRGSEPKTPAAKANSIAPTAYRGEIEPREASGSYAGRSARVPTRTNEAIQAPTVRPATTITPTESMDAAQAPLTTPVPSIRASAAITTPNPARTQPPATIPAANAQAARATTSSASPADEPSHRSAITGSIYDSDQPSIAANKRTRGVVTRVLPPVFAQSSTARSNSYVARNSNPPNSAPSNPASSNSASHGSSVIQMDAQQNRTMEITAPKGFTASYVELPGERVLRSGAITMHMQRSVRVPGERIPGQRWLVRGHKTVSLGELASRVDPAVSQLSAPNGSITVQATIDKDGYVTDLRPLYGNFALLPTMDRAVRAWRYEPTYLDNKTAETQAKIEIDFHSSATRPR